MNRANIASILIIAVGGSGLFAAAASATPAKPELPAWFHWGGTSDRHNHHPCILTWGGKGQRKAEICSDGYAAAK